MRIGLIAPPWVPVPPPGYGGTEVVVDNLARGLQAQGHDVRLFTVGESTCPVPRSWRFPTAVGPMGAALPEAAHLLDAYEALADRDVIHDHTMLGPLLSSGRTPPGTVVVTTAHGTFSEDARRLYAATADRVALVAISADQRASAPELPVAAVIHHGIDLQRYRAGPGGGGYLLFIGRMSADKGPHRAIEVARRTGRRLVIVTKMRDPGEHDYHRQVIRPLLGPDVEVYGELDEAQRIELLRHADALLDPIEWQEPFGLVMAEALACGTPVLAYPRGAAPEIVMPGRTGFLCADVPSMAAAVRALDRISRDDCRHAAETHFSLERMVADHVRLYELLVNGRRPAVISLSGAPAALH